MIQSNSLLENTMALAIVPNSNHVIVSSKERFQVLEFAKEYPNSKAFCLFQSVNKTLELPSVTFLEPDGNNVWFTLSSQRVFQSYNMTNEISPQQIASYSVPSISTNEISLAKNRAFLTYFCDIRVIDTSSGLTPLAALRSKDGCFIQGFQISKNENIGFLHIQEEDDEQKLKQIKLKVINFTDFSSIIETPFAEFTTEYRSPQIIQPKNADLLFFMLNQLHIYNVSDPLNPIFITSQSLGSNEGVGNFRLYSLTLSQDTKTLFALTYSRGPTYTLNIFNISNLTDFQLIQAFALPKITASPGKRPFILSIDEKKGFVITDQNLLAIDLRNLTSPAILGVIPLGLANREEVQNFFLSADEKSGYVHTSNRVFKINLELTYTLYLPQENFLIGKRYSDSVMLLGANGNADFILTSSADYKIIKLSLFDLQVIPSQNIPLTTYNPLPSWISFDYENQILTIESKRQRDLGPYTFYSLSSKKIPREAFNSIFSNPSLMDDLLTSLISLGYIDNQRFLTTSFGSFADFLLPSQYAGMKAKIYQILWFYRIETFTDFNVLPSLKLSTIPSSGKFVINTESYNSIKIDIRLLDPRAQFLQKAYGNALLLITENKNRLTIEGSLDSVNKALRELVININSTELTTCKGEINIYDNLNPPLSQTYTNISDYFFKNEIPKLNTSQNSSAQQQIDAVSLYTGQYFSINLDSYTFKDQYSDSLTYILVAKEDEQDDDSLPSWLSFQGLTLKGTPPEELFQREYKFGLIVKNEFKQIEISVVLNIKIY